MKFRNIDNVHEFLAVVNSCEGDVYLISPYGDKYNLKSQLSQYVAIGALLGAHGDELELFADLKDDEKKLLNFLNDHPEVLDINREA